MWRGKNFCVNKCIWPWLFNNNRYHDNNEQQQQQQKEEKINEKKNRISTVSSSWVFSHQHLVLAILLYFQMNVKLMRILHGTRTLFQNTFIFNIIFLYNFVFLHFVSSIVVVVFSFCIYVVNAIHFSIFFQVFTCHTIYDHFFLSLFHRWRWFLLSFPIYFAESTFLHKILFEECEIKYWLVKQKNVSLRPFTWNGCFQHWKKKTESKEMMWKHFLH